MSCSLYNLAAALHLVTLSALEVVIAGFLSLSSSANISLFSITSYILTVTLLCFIGIACILLCIMTTIEVASTDDKEIKIISEYLLSRTVPEPGPLKRINWHLESQFNSLAAATTTVDDEESALSPDIPEVTKGPIVAPHQTVKFLRRSEGCAPFLSSMEDEDEDEVESYLAGVPKKHIEAEYRTAAQARNKSDALQRAARKIAARQALATSEERQIAYELHTELHQPKFEYVASKMYLSWNPRRWERNRDAIVARRERRMYRRDHGLEVRNKDYWPIGCALFA